MPLSQGRGPPFFLGLRVCVHFLCAWALRYGVRAGVALVCVPRWCDVRACAPLPLVCLPGVMV